MREAYKVAKCSESVENEVLEEKNELLSVAASFVLASIGQDEKLVRAWHNINQGQGIGGISVGRGLRAREIGQDRIYCSSDPIGTTGRRSLRPFECYAIQS